MSAVWVGRAVVLVMALWAHGAAAQSSNYADEGAAYAACMAAGSEWMSFDVGYRRKPTCERGASVFNGWGEYTPNGTTWQRSDFGVFGFTQLCLSRPEQTGWANTAQRVCHDGCAYGLYSDGSGGHYYSTFNDTANASFGVCTNGEETPPPEPGGTDPGDGGGGGSEIPGDGGGGGSDGGGDNGGGSGSETGGGGGDGGGDGDGDGDGDGGGDGGSGGGPGTGTGDGDGEGNEPGAPTTPSGELYTKSDKTMESVYREFRTEVMQTDTVKGISGFMQVPSGGSCPVFSIGASKYWGAMTYNAHCSGTFLAMLTACGWVILAIAAYAAVKIALT